MKYSRELLADNISHALKTANRILILGIPGVGKTHFCFKYCEKTGRNYVIIDCEYDYTFFENLISIKNDPDFFEKFRKLCEINGNDFDKTIFVFDNVESSPLFSEEIYDFMVRTDFTMIMTARTVNSGVERILADTDCLNMYPADYLTIVERSRGYRYADMIMTHTSTATRIPELLHRDLERECEYFMLYGGIPGAYETYKDRNKNLEELKTVHESNRFYSLEKILEYSELTDSEKQMCRLVVDSVFEQMLFTDYNRFHYKMVKVGLTSRNCEKCIDFLVRNKILLRVRNFENPDSFLLYYYDSGILYHKLLQLSNKAKTNRFDKHLFKIINRNYVATELVSNGITPCYRKSKNKAYLDFVFSYKEQKFACRIADKDDSHDKKLMMYGIENPDTWLVKLCSENFEVHGKKITLPFYAISGIKYLRL